MNSRVPYVNRNFVNIGRLDFRKFRYVFTGRVYDSTVAFDENSKTLDDLSGEGNKTVLKTGRYYNFDGTGDQVDFANLSAFATTPAKIVGKARSSTDTSTRFQLNDLALDGTIVDNNLWQEFEAEVPADILANENKMWFDGVDDQVTFSAISLTENFTITTNIIFGEGGRFLSNATYQGVIIYSNQIVFRDTSPTNTTIASGFTLLVGKSYDIVIECVDGVFTTYLDGNVVGSDVTTAGKPSVTTISKTASLGFGGSILFLSLDVGNTGTSDLTFNGTVASGNSIGTVQGSPQTVQQYLRNITTYTIANDGTNPAYAGDLSDIRIQDSGGNNLHRCLHAGHLYDEAADSLNNTPVLDSVAGNHGTMVGGSSFTGEGMDLDVVGDVFEQNEAMAYFDASGQYISYPSNPIPAGGTRMGAEFRCDDTTGITYLFGSQLSGSDGNRYLRVNSGSVEFEAWSSVGGFEVTSAISAGQTYEVEGRINTSLNRLELWVDGALVDTQATTGTFTTLHSNFVIGARPDNTANNQFTGLILSAYVTNEDGTSTLFNVVNGGAGTGDWNDTVASLVGTVNGNPVTVGQKRETILQTAGMDWNRGDENSILANEYVSDFSEGIDGWRDFNGSLTNEAGPIFGETDVLKYTTDVSGGSIAAPYVEELTVGKFYHISGEVLIPSGNNTIDGFKVNDGLASLVEDEQNFVARDVWLSFSVTGQAGNLRLEIRGLEGVSQVISDPEGDDIIYVRNVVINEIVPIGSLIPESDSTAGEDALGNAIANPRPTADTWNPFGDGEYGVVKDADSLDITTEVTWELWGNFYDVGSLNVILSKDRVVAGTRSWNIKGASTLGRVFLETFDLAESPSNINILGLPNSFGCLHIVFSSGVLTGYFNGVSASVTGTPPAELNTSTTDVVIGGRSDITNFIGEQISRPKIYNRALTAEEVLRNYNAQKSKFGL